MNSQLLQFSPETWTASALVPVARQQDTSSPTAVQPMSASTISDNVLVANLPKGTDDAMLRNMFAHIGHIVSAKVMVDIPTGALKGFGFVRFTQIEDAIKAVETMNKAVPHVAVEGAAAPGGESGTFPLQPLHVAFSTHSEGKRREEESSTLYVANLPSDITEEAVRAVFNRPARVVDVTIPNHRVSGSGGHHGANTTAAGRKCIGIALVRYHCIEDARRALEALQHTSPFIDSQAIQIRFKDGHNKGANHSQTSSSAGSQAASFPDPRFTRNGGLRSNDFSSDTSSRRTSSAASNASGTGSARGSVDFTTGGALGPHDFAGSPVDPGYQGVGGMTPPPQRFLQPILQSGGSLGRIPTTPQQQAQQVPVGYAMPTMVAPMSAAPGPAFVAPVPTFMQSIVSPVQTAPHILPGSPMVLSGAPHPQAGMFVSVGPMPVPTAPAAGIHPPSVTVAPDPAMAAPFPGDNDLVVFNAPVDIRSLADILPMWAPAIRCFTHLDPSTLAGGPSGNGAVCLRLHDVSFHAAVANAINAACLATVTGRISCCLLQRN